MPRFSIRLLKLIPVLFFLALVSCGSDDSSSADPVTGDGMTPGNGVLSDGSVDLGDIPHEEVVKVPDSDLTVVYSLASLKESVSSDYVASQWESMKTCLGSVVGAPVVLVVDGWLPSHSSDDILLSFDGRLLASTTFRESASDIVRISTFDFDGSQGNTGFHLRSILGRYLWSVSGYPIRDYNTGCASGTR